MQCGSNAPLVVKLFYLNYVSMNRLGLMITM